jgi:choice-of-anchor A domain-containing protein
MKKLATLLLAAFTCFILPTFAQSPTAPALGFNVFLQNGATFINNETEGPVAIGGNLTIGGSYQVSTNQTGTYTVNSVKVTLLVGGKILYSAGNSLQVNQNGYVKIGDSTGSYVWYKDNNNAYSPIRITPGNTYNASPKISLSANSLNLGVSATNNPVFQGNLIDFPTVFTDLKFKSTSMSLCSDNTLLTTPNGNPLASHTGLPNQVKITLATGINYLNLAAADMNAVQNFTFNNQPSSTRILIINVNAPGTFNWNVWNTGGIGGSNTPFILYNFYNTTTLNIQGNGSVEGTVFAPYADITKTANHANVEGQVIAQSYYHNGGENHYYPFTPSVAGCAVAPVASFTTNQTTQCITSNAFVFSNTSTGGSGLLYKWTFGDGSSSTLENPTKTYVTAGTYTIKLVVRGAGGSDSTTQTVSASGVFPAAGFSINDTAQFLTGNAFVLTTTGSNAGNQLKWNFGDGSISTDINPTKSYSTSGTFAIKQVVTATNGCKDSLTKTVLVKNVIPTAAAFLVNSLTQCVSGNSFTFNNASLGTSITQKWYFGDGVISENSNPTKTYAAPGTYSVKLVVSGLGGKDSVTKQLTVNPMPLTGFILNDTAQFISGNTFTCTPTSIDSTHTYQWYWGDGSNASGFAPVKSYASIGTYGIREVVTSVNGCKDSTMQTIVVKSPSLTVASFRTDAAEIQCLSSNLFPFTSLATGSGTLTYAWDFGDNSFSTLANPTKTYAATGTYNVKLVVTGAGGIDSTTHTLVVSGAPAAGFLVNDSSQFVAGNQFSFTSTDTIPNSSFSWAFGDSSFATDKNPVKVYALAGTYNVTQQVSSPIGCTNTFSLLVTVKPVLPTVASYTLTNPSQCLVGNNFHFTNTSSGSGTLAYAWSFGDGTISSMLNPTKTYTAAGTYMVTLYTEGLGGLDSSTQSITVNNATAGFSVNDTTQMVLGNSFVFTATGLSGYTYFWNFGDGTTTASANPVKSYSNPGNYWVKQVATSSVGCKDSLSLLVYVTPIPTTIANFTPDNSTQCLGNAFTFFNASIGNGTLSYTWDFGDGTYSTDLSPSKTYASSGVYAVRLTTTGNGGTDTLSKTVTVIPNAVKGFTINNSIQTLTGNSFSFTTTTVVAGNTYKWNFDDNTVSTDVNPLKTYFSPGSYAVKQLVTSANGCKDSLSQTVIVESDSVGSGNGGGLESKSLSGMVTKRDYLRQKNSMDTRIDYKRLPVFSQHSGPRSFMKTGSLTLAEMLPSHLDPNDVPRVTTPQDLIQLTIALEVLAVDYTLNNQAKGAVLGIKTAGTAYNHTKPVCDRLRGATLVSVDTVRIQQYLFTRFALKQADNTIEYGISFVAGTQAGRNNYSLQAHWLVSQYTNEDTMYTFQVWSTQPSYTTKLVTDILNNLKGSMPLNQLDQPTLPKAFVSHGERQKENLLLTIQNTTEETFGKVVFNQRLNEQSATDVVEVQLVLARFEKKEFSIPVKDGYEYDGIIYLENLAQDAIYMADGNWGLDYDATHTTVSEYTVINNPTRVYANNSYAVYRDVNVKGTTNDYLTVYKATSQGNSKTDLTAYNNLTFFAKGKGNVTVRLTKDAIVNWNNQYATTIQLDTAGKVYNIRFSDFHSASQSGAFTANDIKLLGFTFLGNGINQQDISFSVKDVSFNTTATGLKETKMLEPLGVYPNPSNGSFAISFAATTDENLELVVTDLLGKTVSTKKVTALKGNNITRVDLETAQSGYYLVSLRGATTPYRAVKILIQ